MASKKQGTSALAGSPTDFVPEVQNSPGGRSLKSGFYVFSHRLLELTEKLSGLPKAIN